MKLEKTKKYSLETMYVEDDYWVRRSQFKNTLYIYVYKRSFVNYYVVVALKVIALE